MSVYDEHETRLRGELATAVNEHCLFQRHDPVGCKGWPESCVTITPALKALLDFVRLRAVAAQPCYRPEPCNQMADPLWEFCPPCEAQRQLDALVKAGVP